ncbi:MAG: DUF4139 domain-containing protein [Anaerolineae bacterium]
MTNAIVPPGQRLQVALTLYNEGSALVADRRHFHFEPGVNALDFSDVAALLDATSVQFHSLTDAEGTRVLEQNYAYDLVDRDALLRRFLDQTIEVIAEDGTHYSGILLSGNRGDIILRSDSGPVTVIPTSAVRDLRMPDLPGGLITRPTLRWLLESAAGGEQDVELTYLTGGLSWTADYTLLIAPTAGGCSLNGWVTLQNTSGTTYADAKVKLLAGEVHRIAPPPAPAAAPMKAVARTAPAPAVETRTFSEYHLYQIQRAVTVADQETKQVEFVAAPQVQSNTFYVFGQALFWGGYQAPVTDENYGSEARGPVQTYLEFETGEEGVNAALPAGRARVYQQDVDGAALLVGEDHIPHTPKGERVRLKLGNAFDLVGERKRMTYRTLGRSSLEESFEIRLRNRKETQSVEIRVPERLFRWSNWSVTQSSHPYTQRDSATIEYRVPVPAGEEVVITYTVRYSW